MSMRYLRKIQNHGNKKIDVENIETSVVSTKNHNNDNNVTQKTVNFNQKSFNVFDLLSDSSSVNDKTDDSDNNQSDVEENTLNQQNSTSPHNHGNETNNKKKNRKKNRKKKVVSIIEEQNKKDIDVNLDELSISLNLPCSSNDNQSTSACLVETPNSQTILKIQQKYLNAENELKRLCGSRAVSDNLISNQRRNKSLVSNNLRCFKKMYLTESCKWSPSTSSAAMKNFGLSMAIDNDVANETNSKTNIQYFVFVHDNSYKEIQKKFFAAVESKNPQNIVNIVVAYPYHVDTLIQFAEIHKLNEDLQSSAEYIERALRCLEFSFHPAFNIISGNCRLSYKKQTNRALYIALFQHLMFIAGRACYRTSLELLKVLLSFDPDSDPLACILIIDWLAIRAKEYQWFIDFCEVFNKEKNRNLTQLPNIAYGLALAYFHLQDNCETADELLQNALLMFPNVLSGLIEKCGIKPDKKVLNHSYFFNNNIESKALKKIEDLYVVRSHHLWRDNNILAWLEKNVNSVINKIDSNQVKAHIKYCEVKRKQRYQGQLPRNISRHIILSDIKEVTLSHPDIQANDNIFSYDPLPPADSIDVYDNNTRLAITNRTDTNTSTNSNLLSLFFSSLFPNAEQNENIQAVIDHLRENDQDEFD
ncbi:transcription factor 25 [Chelonus insularis]|uniref:transcription factor 25 n=1 Tax=Chelonus insularis TaxID=460826 RepID=UPI00158D0192|nr:transcription factor 25 [Chelonus insularis]